VAFERGSSVAIEMSLINAPKFELDGDGKAERHPIKSSGEMDFIAVPKKTSHIA
jgi:hypothetical protein